MEFDPHQDPNSSVADKLVGEDKPFKDLEALAKSKIEADSFIEKLKSENAEMRKAVGDMETKATEAATMDAIMEAVRTLSTDGNNSNDLAPAGDENENGNQSGLSEADILNLVQRTLKQNDTATKQESNYESVRDAFKKRFEDPDKARLEYKAAAQSLGMTESELDSISKVNPTLVLRAAGLDKPSNPNAEPSYLGSDTNPEANRMASEEAHDNEWWVAERKKRGNKWYFQPHVQQRYWKDADAMGDKFIK